MSVVAYAAAIPLALASSWLVFGLFVLVAIMWLIPDRRIEKSIMENDERPTMNPTIKLFLALALGLTASLTLAVAATFSGQEPLPLVYISPQPGAVFVSAYTAIAVRQGEEINRTGLSRACSRSRRAVWPP